MFRPSVMTVWNVKYDKMCIGKKVYMNIHKNLCLDCVGRFMD